MFAAYKCEIGDLKFSFTELGSNKLCYSDVYK